MTSRGRVLALSSIVLVVSLPLVAGCAKTSRPGPAQGCPLSGGIGDTVIGVSIQNCEADFYHDMISGMQARATKFGYRLDVRDASRRDTTQKHQVEDFIGNHVNAIILTPHNSLSKDLRAVIDEADQKNIPMFTADIALESSSGVSIGCHIASNDLIKTHQACIVSHIASNNRVGGQQAGDLMYKAIRCGEVAIIDERYPEVSSVVDRVAGFEAELKKHCPHVGEVVDINGFGEHAKSAAATEDVLQSHPKVTGIFAINNDSALGAADAIAAFKPHHEVFVVGYDRIPDVRSLAPGASIYGAVVQDPGRIGADAVNAVHSYLSERKSLGDVLVPTTEATR